MTGLFLFVLISSFMDHSKAAVKPWVTLDPDWKKIFRGSSVTLTCNSKYTGWEIQDYKWYKDNEPMYVNQRTLTIDSAKMRDNGNYQCETTDSERSDHVRLDVSDGLLILQAPVAVYEGDTLTMQCLGRNKYFEKDSSFYKYEKRLSSTGSVLRLQNVNSKMSGQYKCTRERATILSYKKEDAWTSLSVSDLFSVPVIKLVQSPVKEGGDMTLSCDTALAPPRQDTGLRFAFYRDERTVQDFSVSTIYSVLSTQLGHSGYYTCDVRTPSGGVMKRSNMLYIHIHELFKSPELQISPSQMVLEGEDVSLQCVTTSNTGARLLYTFYRDSQAVQGATADSRYLIPQAGQEHSGDYMCSVQSTDERVMKTSTDGNLLVQKLFNSPELQISPSQMVLEGEDIRLQCVTTSNTGARLLYTFYRDSQAIQGATADSSYIITQAGEENTGDYKCSVQSMGGNIQRNSTDLHILVQTGTDQPQIELRPEMVLLGGEVVLLCESRNGSLPIHYRFYHDGTLIGNRTVHEKKAAELTLTNSSLTMAGPYYCDSGNEVSSQTQLSNIISLHVMDFDLSLSEECPMPQLMPGDDEGETSTLHLRAISPTPPEEIPLPEEHSQTTPPPEMNRGQDILQAIHSFEQTQVKILRQQMQQNCQINIQVRRLTSVLSQMNNLILRLTTATEAQNQATNRNQALQTHAINDLTQAISAIGARLLLKLPIQSGFTSGTSTPAASSTLSTPPRRG
ncbi:Fc receptor-like protein 3 isoform X2 [Pseudophryne corroboree]|uniref:Fc receptor-like protein 3 isoform X2 n=1 Tax=Pseudophryne corroboree TaxID=495146 RepID=UPI003081CC50